MSKNLNKPEHYAENGSLIQDQWYLHTITLKIGILDNAYIYMFNKSNTPVTLSNIEQQLKNTIWHGVGYNQVDYEIYNTAAIIGVGGCYNGSTMDLTACVAYNNSGSNIALYTTKGAKITSVSDSVTPY